MTRPALWSVGLLLVALSCSKDDEKSATSDTSAAESGSEQDTAPALDPELAEAVAAASASAAAGPSAPGAAPGQGPPPKGIFPPGAADAQIRPEAPPQITVGSTGSEPRLQLTGGFGAKGRPVVSRIAVMLQSGQGGLPVDFELQFEESPLPAPAPAGQPGASVEGEPRAQGQVRGRVVRATVSQGAGRVPAELNDAVAKLRGAEVTFDLWPNGAATGFRTEMKAGAPRELGDVVRALGDAVATATLPYPDEAVGVGGYWMVTSRDGLMGLDLVSYRLIRVDSITDGAATLQVSTKRYAAGNDFSLPNLQGDFLLEELQSGGEGALRYRPGRSLPFRGTFQLSLSALVSPRGAQPGAARAAQRGTLQFASEARFSAPE